MSEFSFLIGGRAGDGIRQGGYLIAKLFNELGYWSFVYDDYPSLITGGHNFSIVRVAEKKIFAHGQQINFCLAFNEETIKKHFKKFKKNSLLIYDLNQVKKAKGLGISMTKIIQENHLPMVVRNAIGLGALAGVLNLDFSLVKKIIQTNIHQKIVENIKVAQKGYQEGRKFKSEIKIKKLSNKPKSLLTGNEAIALGAVQAGLKFYFAYPMTPATSILHFLAAHQEQFGIKVVQPENEIAAALMAEGAAYAGARTMVGTSGGGFALMVESLSLAGQAEIPIVYVYGQRPGPSTGVPTYTAQSDLFFVLFAGHGEFSRIVVAPGDVDQAFYLTGEAMNLAWRYQVPAFVLTDKHLSESVFSADFDKKKVREENPKIWSGRGEYKRYLITKDGISPLTFPGNKKAIVKSNSYEHDEDGLTTDEPEKIKKMIEKRLKKREVIINELRKKETVKVCGRKKSKTALITWGSSKGAAVEVGEKLGLKVIQPLFLEPFPEWQVKKELRGVKKIITVEVNATGQLAALISQYGISYQQKILRYDGRPFTVDELEKRIKSFV